MNPIAALKKRIFGGGASKAPEKSVAPLIEEPGAKPDLVLERLKKLQQEYDGDPQKVGLTGALINGYQSFLETKKTPDEAYFAMRTLFALTNGQSNDIISGVLSQVYPPNPVISGDMLVLGDRLENIIRGMKENGYWGFSQKVPPEVVQSLLEFAKTTPAIGRGTGEEMLFEDMAKGNAVVFQFKEHDVANCPGAKWFLNNIEFQEVARRYLGSEPLIDLVTMWWSLARNSSEEERSRAAQAYHFDMDRFKFFKIFMYVNDVTLQNGAHFFVKGTHLSFNNPCFLRDGRFSDANIQQHYDGHEILMEGTAGTVFLEDTRGLHKGSPLQSGERLIFEICYTNSFFGAPYQPISLEDKSILAQKDKSRVFEKFS